MSILEEIVPKAHLVLRRTIMKSIDINNFSLEEAKEMINELENLITKNTRIKNFDKFKSESGLELVFTLIQKKTIETVTIINGNWIGTTKEGETLLCGQFHQTHLLEFFKEMYTDHQDIIMMMTTCVLVHMPAKQKNHFRNFIMELIG